jgi:hypothetical protein
VSGSDWDSWPSQRSLALSSSVGSASQPRRRLLKRGHPASIRAILKDIPAAEWHTKQVHRPCTKSVITTDHREAWWFEDFLDLNGREKKVSNLY